MVRADDGNTEKHTTSGLPRYVENARYYQPGRIELAYECDANLDSADDEPAIANDDDDDDEDDDGDDDDDEAKAEEGVRWKRSLPEHRRRHQKKPKKLRRFRRRDADPRAYVVR